VYINKITLISCLTHTLKKVKYLLTKRETKKERVMTSLNTQRNDSQTKKLQGYAIKPYSYQKRSKPREKQRQSNNTRLIIRTKQNRSKIAKTSFTRPDDQKITTTKQRIERLVKKQKHKLFSSPIDYGEETTHSIIIKDLKEKKTKTFSITIKGYNANEIRNIITENLII